MPSLIEKIQKIIHLEAEMGFENRAVVGGLEKFLPNWENEARTTRLNPETIESVVTRFNQYRGLELEQRIETLKELDALLLIAARSEPKPTNSSQMQQSKNDSKKVNFQPQRQPPSSQPRPAVDKRVHPSITRPAESPTSAALNAPLTVLNGIGPKNAQVLQLLELRTLEDLLYYFPRRYDDYSQLKPINRLQFGEELTVIGSIQSIVTRSVRGGQSHITEAVLTDGTGFLRLTWFNQPYLAARLPPDTQIVLSGKVSMYLGHLVINSPDWEYLDQQHLHTNRIVPVYSLSGRITQHWLRKIMHQTVTFWAPRIQEYMPESIRQSAALPELTKALAQIHFPDSNEALLAARSRLAFDEIFFLQLGVLRQKRSWQMNAAQVFAVPDEWLAPIIESLPFTLTGAQQKVLAETRADLASGKPMNRLLQGDVGSGKTIIAALAVAIVAKNGAQSAILAPTSILADQHYRNMQQVLTGAAGLEPGQIRLLVGDTSETEKREIRAGLEDGSIRLVIGTHALLEDPVTFARLQLAVIDEQHRFGVAQRAILRAKGENPHLLVMTATPIPRSLALTIYGDLDLSVMDEMPAGRIPVETHMLHPQERERAYQLIRGQVQNGSQAFIIYPLVEKGDRDEGKAAVDEHARLQSEIFPKFKLGLLHGRLKPEEKERVMAQFRDGEYQVLVSTSVVEVGVDVPNATVMLIEGANRFGLAQLHQFRGRVGRGTAQSYCILIPENEDAIENQRLAAMEETNDGFILAEHDLDQRGPGEFLGTRQSGYAEFRMANLTDIRMIEKARQQALALFERDPEMTAPENAALLTTFHRIWGVGRGDVS